MQAMKSVLSMSKPATLLPRRLPYADRTLVLSGPGRSPSGQCYLDAQAGAFLELYPAQTIQTVPVYALICVPGNQTLAKVRVSAIPGYGIPRDASVRRRR